MNITFNTVYWICTSTCLIAPILYLVFRKKILMTTFRKIFVIYLFLHVLHFLFNIYFDLVIHNCFPLSHVNVPIETMFCILLLQESIHRYRKVSYILIFGVFLIALFEAFFINEFWTNNWLTTLLSETLLILSFIFVLIKFNTRLKREHLIILVPLFLIKLCFLYFAIFENYIRSNKDFFLKNFILILILFTIFNISLGFAVWKLKDAEKSSKQALNAAHWTWESEFYRNAGFSWVPNESDYWFYLF